MAITPQLSWLDRVQQTLAIERESDAFSRTTDDDPESTYWTRDDVERLQCEIDQQLMRIVPDWEVQQMGGIDGPPRVGLIRHDFANGDAIEQGVVRIVAAVMQTAAQNPFFTVKLASLAEWAQLAGAAAHGFYTLFAGNVQFTGWRLRLLYVVEPQLADFQSDAVFIPPASYAELAHDWVHHQLTAADLFPVGRI